jgi:hypothetical protein
MYIYIDETEDKDYFVVGGILVEEENTLTSIHKRITKIIKRQKYSAKTKSLLLTELKDYQLNKSYRILKRTVLNELAGSGSYYYSLYIKKKHFKQVDKEKMYIRLLKEIASKIDSKINIVYDEFRLQRFHNNIEVELIKLDNVISIESGNSQSNKSLQFADIICGTIRRYHQDQDTEMFNLIKNKVIDIL